MYAGIRKILVTGGAGFIGSAFVRLAVSAGYKIIVVDKLTYAGDLARLQQVKGKYKFYKADISDSKMMDRIIRKERPQIIVNFAAETHVDRSIIDSARFMKTNVIGTQVLLDISKKYKINKFIQISTDEVYGEIKKGRFTEGSPLRPNSPYAASKAAADLIIRSYIRTYGLEVIIIRPSNNFGPWQYPEKFIPLAIVKLFRREKVPVYGVGKNVREWLYVDDCAQAILKIAERGKAGQIYNLGSAQEKRNIEVIGEILRILKRDKSAIEFVRDRQGHDIRYSLDSSNAHRQIKWHPNLSFLQGIYLTVNWNIDNKKWLLGKFSKEHKKCEY